jgi:hypothetical protein
MNLNATTVSDYLEKVPEDTKAAFNQLRLTVLNNLPEGFKEELSYGMIGSNCMKRITSQKIPEN